MAQGGGSMSSTSVPVPISPVPRDSSPAPGGTGTPPRPRRTSGMGHGAVSRAEEALPIASALVTGVDRNRDGIPDILQGGGSFAIQAGMSTPMSVPISPAQTPRRGNRDIEPLMICATCPEHPDEIPLYFCATCECQCVCAECVVHGRHQGHEVMKVNRAHEALRARAGTLLDEALALEDDFAVVQDKMNWRRKDVERAAARGRASVRSAFARVRAQLADREAELLESLDSYEHGTLSRLDSNSNDHDRRLCELQQLRDTLRANCRTGEAVQALNAYASAKAAMASLRDNFRAEELSAAGPPDEFVGLAGSARAELDLHAEGLASLEEAVASLCERGIDFPHTAFGLRSSTGSQAERPQADFGGPVSPIHRRQTPRAAAHSSSTPGGPPSGQLVAGSLAAKHRSNGLA